MSEAADPIVHFGGPDLPPRLLRDLLRARIDAVPARGSIAWATYYFRDRDLAEGLVAACERGVRVILQVEGEPRLESANRLVLDRLRRHGLGGGLRIHRPDRHGSHLHAKIYYFSHPVPHALVGSFNPSGDVPEDAAVIAEIGDQDRGHNLLVELTCPILAEGLRGHVAALDGGCSRWRNRRPLHGRQAVAWFYPRFHPHVIEPKLRGTSAIRGCISHLKSGSLTQRLKREARRGADVRLVVHDTERRVPEGVIADLGRSGIEIRRFRHPEGLPMHAKFILADETAWFGSFNYNRRSLRWNDEILLSSRHHAIVEPLQSRFMQIAASCV